jgi:hypothetical protein
MANLDRIQEQLNSSDQYRQRFLEDPVAALAAEGLHLSFEMQTDLRRQVTLAKARSGKGPGKSKLEYMRITLSIVLVTSSI